METVLYHGLIYTSAYTLAALVHAKLLRTCAQYRAIRENMRLTVIADGVAHRLLAWSVGQRAKKAAVQVAMGRVVRLEER